MTALGGGRKNPLRSRGGLAYIEQGGDPVGQGNRAPRIHGFSEGNMHRAVADLLPFQPVTLLGPNTFVQQDGGHIPQQERVFWLGWTLPTLGGSDSLQGARVRFQSLLADRVRRLKICGLLGWTEDPFPPALARQKRDGRHRLLYTSPFNS